MSSYDDRLGNENTGFSRKDVQAGGKGETQVLNRLKPISKPGRALIHGTTFGYTSKEGQNRAADIDIALVCGERITIIDAKQWRSGKFARRFFFGPVRLFPSPTKKNPSKRPVKYPAGKDWPAVSALAPQWRSLNKYLTDSGVDPVLHDSFTVMTNPRSSFGIATRKTTQGTRYMTWDEFSSWSARPPKPGDVDLTSRIVKLMQAKGGRLL